MTTTLVHIVDDDAHVRASTSFLLQSRGYATKSHVDGRAFLDQASLEPGCVLLDLRMPHMNGIDVQRMLKERNIDLPVIILSGHGDARAAAEAEELGAVGFLEKPYAEADLIAAIARAERIAEDRREREVA